MKFFEDGIEGSLRYEPRSSEWLGLIMNALTLDDARAELESVQ